MEKFYCTQPYSKIKIKEMRKIILVSMMLLFSNIAYSQLNPMGSIYYHNQYVANPAMAGITKGWELNAAIKAQWTVIDDGITMQTVSAAYGSANNKTGFGLLLYNDKAGVVQRTSVKATYAYHLPISSGSTFLDFGLSGGVMDESIKISEVKGDLTDVGLGNFNDRKLYLDIDFGLSFRAKHLTVQGALPNLKRYFDKDDQRNLVDRATIMAAIAYKINIKSTKLNSVEPKIMYRNVENFKDIIDIGSNFIFSEGKLQLSGIYHTSGSMTFGAGTLYKNKLTILAQYTTNTTELGSYSNGEAEIALKYNF